MSSHTMKIQFDQSTKRPLEKGKEEGKRLNGREDEGYAKEEVELTWIEGNSVNLKERKFSYLVKFKDGSFEKEKYFNTYIYEMVSIVWILF